MGVSNMNTTKNILASKRSGLDVDAIRLDFPALEQTVSGHPLVYLDNAASTQKPRGVIDAITQAYTYNYANVHRGVHHLSEQATQHFELARRKVKQFINAAEEREVIFVRGTTEAINMVASCFGRRFIKADDEIVITGMEHHSNIVPWQMLCEQTGANLRVVPVFDNGELDIDAYERLLCDRTKLVAVVHISNALGTINPIKSMIAAAHRRGIPVLVDGAQAVSHTAVDVQALGCDFYAFSSHKLFGPTGIGVLYGRAALLEQFPPYQGGGEMIREVTFERTTYAGLPNRLEAGTPHIVGAIGLGAAIDYVTRIGLPAIAAYENELLAYATDAIAQVPGLRIIGTAREKAGVIAFVLDDVHAHDIGTIVDQYGVAVRSGHHCAMPLMNRFSVAATTRASFAFYNTHSEVDTLVSALRRVREIFA